MKNSKKKFKNADGSIRHSAKEVGQIVGRYLGKMWGMDLIKFNMGIRDLGVKSSNITSPRTQRKQRVQRRVSVKK